MKAEHRHDLKTNELAHWLADFPDWAKNNLKTIIYVAVVVILVAAAYIWNAYQKNVLVNQRATNFTNLARTIERQKPQLLQAGMQGQDLSYTLLQNAEQLKNVAKDTKNDDMAALAFIKEAQAVRMELHYRLEIPSEDDKLQQLTKAKESYSAAAELAKTPQIIAQARLGLGLCEEELGNYQQASEIYSQIAGNPDFDGVIVKELAAQRLAVLAEYEQPVTFKPAPLRLMPQMQQVQPDPNAQMFGPVRQPQDEQVPQVNLPQTP